jgi:hypothetical protein
VFRILILSIAVAFLGACSDDQSASSQSAAQKSPPPSVSEPAAPTEPAAPAAADEDEISYDPIDVSKLESSWWQQYSSGS